MERRKFIHTCCYTAIGLPLMANVLQSCGSIYYASTHFEDSKMVLAKSEFWKDGKNSKSERTFVLLKTAINDFPIGVYKTGEDQYVASLLKCTHKSCELNVGGGIYSCPCHGSEFTIEGKLMTGPADRDLKTYKIETDNEYIYILIA